MMKPTRATPPSCTARTEIGRFLPVEATAPVVGVISVTFSAWTFDKKIKIESWAQLPAASKALPTILIRPPAPEPDGNLIASANETVVTTDADEKTVSVVAI